jgi:AraC-like DNA-binding protein
MAGMEPPDQASRHERLCERLSVIEEYLDSAADVPPAGTYVRDLGSNEHFWSPELFHLFGLPVAERAPSTDQINATLGRSQFDSILAAAHRCIEERRRLELDYLIQLPTGGVKHLRSVGQGVPSRAGHGPAIMGTVHDLSEYRRVCGALDEAFELLGEVDEKGPLRPRPAELVIRVKAPRFVAGSEGLEAPAEPPLVSHGNRGTGPFASSLDEAAHYRAVPGGLSARQFRRVCDLVSRRLREPLEVAELAAAVGLSASHFARAFKQTTGKAPHQFIVEQRLERARVALASGNAGKVSGVAIEFGFFDQSHFTRHFRRKFGLTPGEVLRRGITRK